MKEEEELGVIERRHSSWMARNWEVEEEKLETVGWSKVKYKLHHHVYIHD